MTAVAFIALPFLAFIIYDRKVSRQQEKIVSNALRTDAIISELFPSNIRDQLYKPTKNGDDNDDELEKDDNVIAVFYPETTVLFAGNMKWSKARAKGSFFSTA